MPNLQKIEKSGNSSYLVLPLNASIHTAPWPPCPNKNVFCNRLNWPYDSPRSLRLGGRLFQTCGPAVVKVYKTAARLVHMSLSGRAPAGGLANDINLFSNRGRCLLRTQKFCRQKRCGCGSACMECFLLKTFYLAFADHDTLCYLLRPSK